MFRFPHTSCRPAAALLGLVVAASGWGIPAAGAFDSLRDNSPFLPPRRSDEAPARNTAAAEESEIARNLEFRGMIQHSGTWEFSIYDKTKKSSRWMQVNEYHPSLPYSVVDFDPDVPRVLLRWGSDEDALKMITYADVKRYSTRGHFSNVGSPPAPPPADLVPPSNPPPPPVSAPPSGPPPEIPPEVMRRFESMLAAEENRTRGQSRRNTDGVIAGASGAPPPPPPAGITGLPSARPPASSDGGDTGSPAGNPSVGAGIPDIPGFSPGSGPPTPPPDIDIPDIPGNTRG